MKVTPTKLEGVLILEPTVFGDERGYFMETYNQRVFAEAGIHAVFVQDNQSLSRKGILRGLHFQTGEHAQAKLVRALSGRVLDVTVDLRPGSPTYGQHVAVELSEENRKQMYIPRGFAHGFIVLSDEAVFSYKCDNFYNKAAEGGVRYNDPALGIDWQLPAEMIQVNERDATFPLLAELA
ncbi:MAG: dTDP-4-dehydrorhamnose 3,5-epimerase [Blastochloris viridis]|uniref:dTDP-4-dehydrorhamnose 3,5-epimerase n=1 Tax=Blastochloris viridis TaxID=1079 RepID=A0A6N4RAV6_BLAVI|nr:MAG: dTDP-4-dehydrorhamnose 3,5-epimerase [Blastochloris viridis]